MDADRLAIVSNEGEAIGEDNTRSCSRCSTYSVTKGPVVRLSDDFRSGRCETFGCPVFLTKIGEVNVTDAMQQHDA